MYSVDWSFLLSRTHRGCSGCAHPKPDCAARLLAEGQNRRFPAVSGTVWALGLTSFFTDISSEMVASILPVYLVLHLGLSPLAFGFVDGLYQGAAVLVRVAAGVLSDRWRRYKEVAAVGYALSAACRLLIPAAGAAWGTIAYVIAIDRIGKGIRTAPRDALIAGATPNRTLATAFGVHRALDAGGAMIGPVAAFALLAAVPGGFDLLFVASFAIAIVGVGAILLLVPGASAAPATDDGVRAAFELRQLAPSRVFTDPAFRGIVIAGTVLGLTTISDGFVFLILQRRLELGATAFPLLYVATSLFTAMLAVPFGRMADRVGRTKVLLAGYGLLALVYTALIAPAAGGFVLLALSITLLGGYYAATEGVLTAMAAATLPAERCGSGLAVLATATNMARLTASIAFGWLWTRHGVTWATGVSLVALAGAIVCAAVILTRSKQHASRRPAIEPAAHCS